MIKLRDYQKKAVDEITAFLKKNPKSHGLAILPTGAGKSIICGQLVNDAVAQGKRVLVLTHSKELVQQNYEKAILMNPDIEIGVYSAGLSRKDTTQQVIFGSIQSVYKSKDFDLTLFDYVIVDEAHRISRTVTGKKNREGIYSVVFARIRKQRPDFTIMGLTATPYRLDSGLLYEGDDALFDAIATEVPLRFLVDQGYLCPIYPTKTEFSVSMKGVKKRGGEFANGESADLMMSGSITADAINDVVKKAADFRAWLVFCVTIEHAEQVCEEIRKHGIDCEVVCGNTPTKQRDEILTRFKAGKLRAICNVGVLTTGFDAPICDCVVMLRATASTGLYIQMAGRAMRLFPDKKEAILLDYVGNITRHGFLDNPSVSSNAKFCHSGHCNSRECTICPTLPKETKCEALSPATAEVCVRCGHPFIVEEKASVSSVRRSNAEEKIRRESSEVPLFSWLSELERDSKIRGSVIRRRLVARVGVNVHANREGKTSLRVTYYDERDLEIVSDYLAFNSPNPTAKAIARKKWLRLFTNTVKVPTTTEAAYTTLAKNADTFKKPKSVLVDYSGKFPSIKEIFYA